MLISKERPGEGKDAEYGAWIYSLNNHELRADSASPETENVELKIAVWTNGRGRWIQYTA